MARRYMQRPAILVDHKKFRIRIYKMTLHAIGDPEYIVLIVDPYERSITIMRSEKSDKRAYFIKNTQLDNNRSPEIFSRSIVRDLFSICEFWDKNQSYRVYGEVLLYRDCIRFNLADSAVFLGEMGWQR